MPVVSLKLNHDLLNTCLLNDLNWSVKWLIFSQFCNRFVTEAEFSFCLLQKTNSFRTSNLFELKTPFFYLLYSKSFVAKLRVNFLKRYLSYLKIFQTRLSKILVWCQFRKISYFDRGSCKSTGIKYFRIAATRNWWFLYTCVLLLYKHKIFC